MSTELRLLGGGRDGTPASPEASLPPGSVRLEHRVPGVGGVALALVVEAERILGAEVIEAHRAEPAGLTVPRLPYQTVPLAERLCRDAGAIPAEAYCRAIEARLGWEIPERALLYRVLAAELSRVVGHAGCLSALGIAVGAEAPGAWLQQVRAWALDALETLTGAPRFAHYVRIGGVRHEAPGEALAALAGSLPAIETLVRDVDQTLGRARSFVERLQGTAVADLERCAALEVEGLMARSVGLSTDRRHRPGYAAYAELDFEVAIGHAGDNYDRYLIRMEEIRQSLGLVRQSVERLETLGRGRVCVDHPRVLGATRDDALPVAEMIQHTLAVTEGVALPEGVGEGAAEGTEGPVEFFVECDGGARPVAIRVREPMGALTTLLPFLLEGVPLAELGPTLALVGIMPPDERAP